MTATQLYFGPREVSAFSLVQVESAISAAREIAGIDALMVWPCETVATTERLVQACLACGIEPYLWFPVLADVPRVPARQDELVADFDGRRGNGLIGAWEGLETSDEKFLFSCPNSAPFVDRVFAAFASLLDRLPVRGVMLDRIRFPSPANGFEALLTCFCDRCSLLYQSETGRSLSEQRNRAAAFLQRLRKLTPTSFSAEWRDSDTLWTVSGLAELSLFRVRSIRRVVERFAMHAKGRGLRVGLDLFSPSLCHIVSQDYSALANGCDWLKPMIYRHAHGPAGLPLETACLRNALLAMCPGLRGQEVSRILAQALHMEMPMEGSFPPDALSHELDVIDRMRLPPTVDVLVGIEAVRIPHFGIEVSEDALGEALTRAQTRRRGVVVSWNLLYIPEANLRRIGGMKRHEGI